MAMAFNELMVKGLSTARVVVSDLARGADYHPIFLSESPRLRVTAVVRFFTREDSRQGMVSCHWGLAPRRKNGENIYGGEEGTERSGNENRDGKLYERKECGYIKKSKNVRERIINVMNEIKRGGRISRSVRRERNEELV